MAIDLTRSGPLDPLRGFGLGLRGLGLVFSTRPLARLTLAIAAITVLSLSALGALLWRAVPWLAGLLWTPPATWWGTALFTLLEALSFLLLLVALGSTLPTMLAAPLLDPLSVATERRLGKEVAAEGGVARMAREVARAWANALVRLLVLLAGQLLLLLLLLLPGVGGALWTALSWLWTALWLAAAYLDVPMARHLYPFEQELLALRRRTGLCLGFGASVALMLSVPLLNFFFVPVAVVSATAFFHDLVGAGVLPAPGAQRQS